jgi:hypothetical protein
MRNIIPIIFVASTLLVGCQSSKPASKPAAAGATSAAASTNTVANTNATVSTNAVAAAAATAATAAAPAPVGPNTPDQTLAENNRLGNLAGIFLGVLFVAAIKRP